MSGFTLRGRVVAFLFVALAVCICAPGTVYATTFDTDYPDDCDCEECGCDVEYNLKSLSNDYYEGECDSCDCDEADGSCTYIIEIGTYIAGEEIGETRFDPETDLAHIDLPCGLTFENLDGYEITVLGAFNTHSPNTVHLVTPDPGAEGDPIPPAVQEAFAFAAPFLDQMPQFPEPTTVEMADFIYFTAIGVNPALEEQTSPQEILSYIFVTQAELDAPEDAAFAEAEGDLFPHDPDDDEVLFEFAMQIDPEDGSVNIDVCLTVEIDIKPRSKKNFVWIDRYFALLPVLVLGSDEFAVGEIEKGTLRLGGVKPYCKVFIKDFNCDGNKDLLAVWRVRTLVKQGALGKTTTSLDLTADLTDGGCIKGTDAVKPKWRKKRKKKCW